MNNEAAKQYLQEIRQRIIALQNSNEPAWPEIDQALEELHTIYDQMQASLQVAEVVKSRLLQQNQQIVAGYHYYRSLFQSSPIAHLMTDFQGFILDANDAVTQLLQASRSELIGKSFSFYLAEVDRSTFRANLNQFPYNSGVQVWQMTLCPQNNPPFPVELHLDVMQGNSGSIEGLQIGVYNISLSQQRITQLVQHQMQAASQLEGAMLMSQLPQSLDGLRVLIVDDEADAREFITAVLESHGIQVQALTSAAAALEALAQFRPDVLLSDIRMPGIDGYSLIQQIRALETEQGNHIPAAAMTAYSDEDWTKAISAGYEAYLHKLAQPSEWVEMVAQLAGHRQERF